MVILIPRYLVGPSSSTEFARINVEPKFRLEFSLTETFLPIAGFRVALGTDAAAVRAFAVEYRAILVVGAKVA